MTGSWNVHVDNCLFLCLLFLVFNHQSTFPHCKALLFPFSFQFLIAFPVTESYPIISALCDRNKYNNVYERIKCITVAVNRLKQISEQHINLDPDLH